ncbi:hypothetical protein RIF23_16275 [Lipingzhangella sp. LS1_29]|uniref:Uncharacterized protein n=1 Tax=Lipingzhangella rawalii TaxID=2055835 RepID=A0ABU2H982_9ACTN|nr:hypothetical protein [Lipingzhangella rawalii]MDS1271851.1 hypothetical protein [Lipingzhangella rawalii]
MPGTTNGGRRAISPRKIPKSDPDPDSPDLARALDCEVCREAGIRNHSPIPAPQPRPERKPRPGQPPRLSPHQLQFLRQVWDYLASARPGSNPDERLLALVCLLRAARAGSANLTAQDMQGMRLADPRATVAALTGSGWLQADPEAVLAADAQYPATCSLPEFSGNPWRVGRQVRTRVSGWTTGTLAHKRLRKKSNAVRLTAVYLVTHSTPDGVVEFTAEHLVAACALSGVDELVTALGELVNKGWLADLPSVGADGVRGQLGAEVLAIAPAPETTPAQQPPAAPSTEANAVDAAWPGLDVAGDVTERARLLISGREDAVATWVREFREKHGHGPSWAAVTAAHTWPSRRHRHGHATELAFVLLAEDGWLAGLSEPYGLRPGPRHTGDVQDG